MSLFAFNFNTDLDHFIFATAFYSVYKFSSLNFLFFVDLNDIRRKKKRAEQKFQTHSKHN